MHARLPRCPTSPRGMAGIPDPGTEPSRRRIPPEHEPHLVEENHAGSRAVETKPDLPQLCGMKAGIRGDEVRQRDFIRLEHRLDGGFVTRPFPIGPLRECHSQRRRKRGHVAQRQPGRAAVRCHKLHRQIDARLTLAGFGTRGRSLRVVAVIERDLRGVTNCRRLARLVGPPGRRTTACARRGASRRAGSREA